MLYIILKHLCLLKQKICVQNCNKTFATVALAMGSQGGSNNSWRGVPMSEIYGSQSPWGAPEFPLVVPSYKHAVLYHIPTGGGVVGDRPPKPQIGHEKWDQEHVRMPCSSHSLYPVQDSKGETHLKKRWEMIEAALSKPIHNSQELAEAILSYNTKFRSIWKFKGLHKFFDEYLEEEESQYFFDVTLPEIAKLALALPKLVQAPIPLLKQHKNHSVSLSQQQIASLLANAFFCTFPRRNSRKSTSEYASYPYINFNTNRLYESTDSDSNLEKLKCICHYFKRVCTKAPGGVVTVARRSVAPRGCPAWPRCDTSLASLPLHVDPTSTIEDADGLIQVDFANKFLGGGVLGHGCVQEEIRFVICPELMITMLFTEELRPNEALMIIGVERYSRYSGYGHTFQWAGTFEERAPHDSSGRRRCAVLAVDAQPFGSVLHEYRREAITRELNKAWVGMSFDTDPQGCGVQFPGVCTGNWGCGAFGGSPHLKSLLQAMACAHARRPMAYCTFGDLQLRDYIINVYNLLVRYNVTVGQLYKYLIKFSELLQKNVRLQLYPYLEQVLKGDTLEHAEETSVGTTISQMPLEKADTAPPEQNIAETVISIEEELSNSPDLFSQDEMDVSMTETDVSIKETSKQEQKSEQKPTNRVSLFDSVVKMDENGGRSNPSVSNTSLLNHSQSTALNDSNLSIDSGQRTASATKVKNNRKITDFYSFSKKSI